MLSPLSLANQTPDPVTDSDISDLQTEAGEAGDRAQVRLCELALAGDSAARRECVTVILEQRAAR